MFNELVVLSGRLWRPPAVPAGAGPLGGARRGELRSNRLHRGEQTQRFYPHCCLHPLDRGDAHQRFLPALIRRLQSGVLMVCLLVATETFARVVNNCFLMLHVSRVCCAMLAVTICAIKPVQSKIIIRLFAFFYFQFCSHGVYAEAQTAPVLPLQ